MLSLLLLVGVGQSIIAVVSRIWGSHSPRRVALIDGLLHIRWQLESGLRQRVDVVDERLLDPVVGQVEESDATMATLTDLADNRRSAVSKWWWCGRGRGRTCSTSAALSLGEP